MMECPLCKETMVPSRIEDEEGGWTYCWLCGCNEETRKQNADSPVLCSAGLCARDELIRDLKAMIGVDGKIKGVEYCEVYDSDWDDIIRKIQDAQY
jgi:hypothetical protein